MLAELLGISVSQVRGWQRKGLIQAVREVRRLPYFDFREVATARRIQELLAAGISLRAIEKQLVEVQRLFPHVRRPLAELPIVIEGKRLLVRQPEGLSDTAGQLRFDFDEVEEDESVPSAENEQGSLTTASARHILALSPNRSATGENVRANNVATANEILKMAVELEDAEQLPEAAEMYRAAMAAGGPTPEVCFLLAELLYRLGDISGSRERYYMAIELNEDYVEARANLGCVLVEQGQLELAVAAFQGALAFHSEYADVHYHLARALDDLNQRPAADVHWRTFLDLSPETPWADEARVRLAIL
jgi:tetratricopeptide (TPR) repeat protein